MPKFEVRIYETVYHTVEVEAVDKAEAHQKGYDIIAGNVAGEYDTEAEGFTGSYSIEELD
jgi:galactitol-specific phosphotransferase system IIB component